MLEDGTCFSGKSFGYEAPAAGEVVFNTAMTGYPESLTDPSYEGQILVTTFPQLGNYGVPPSGGDDMLKIISKAPGYTAGQLSLRTTPSDIVTGWQTSRWPNG